MDRTLLINTTFEPISVLSWKKAITLVYLGKVEVLKEYEREIQGVSMTHEATCCYQAAPARSKQSR